MLPAGRRAPHPGGGSGRGRGRVPSRPFQTPSESAKRQPLPVGRSPDPPSPSPTGLPSCGAVRSACRGAGDGAVPAPRSLRAPPTPRASVFPGDVRAIRRVDPGPGLGGSCLGSDPGAGGDSGGPNLASWGTEGAESARGTPSEVASRAWDEGCPQAPPPEASGGPCRSAPRGPRAQGSPLRSARRIRPPSSPRPLQNAVRLWGDVLCLGLQCLDLS